MEYCNTFKDENGTEVKIELKTECSTQEEMRKTLSFIAQSSHRFYLEAGDKIKKTMAQDTQSEYQWIYPLLDSQEIQQKFQNETLYDTAKLRLCEDEKVARCLSQERVRQSKGSN